MRENDWTRLLGWPGYKVYRSEIDEPARRLPDADAAYARAVAAGAKVIRPTQDTPYGSREFTVKDPEGHSWSAGTYDPWAKHE